MVMGIVPWIMLHVRVCVVMGIVFWITLHVRGCVVMGVVSWITLHVEVVVSRLSDWLIPSDDYVMLQRAE